jgi:hypothetical protein
MKYLVLCACALTLCLAGCGEQGGNANVSGKVSANGEKVSSGNLTFSPVGGGLSPVTATIQADGTYKLTGAASGKNRIVFGNAGSAEPVALKPGETAKPPAFSGYSVKTQEVDLKSGDNTLDIELTPPAQ